MSDLKAQQQDARPQAVIAAIFAAQDSGNVATMVGLVDPEAMAEFKQRQVDQDSIFSDLAARHAAEGHPRRTLSKPCSG